MAAALQKEMNDSMALVATTTLGSTERWPLDKGKLQFSNRSGKPKRTRAHYFGTGGGVMSSVLSFFETTWQSKALSIRVNFD